MADLEQLESLTDVTEQRIYQYLKDNNYKPGDSFPKEQDLANMLETSRPIVREALSRFRMLGLLQSRKRRGMVISSPTIFKTLKKIIDPAFLSEEEQRGFYNLRVIIELGLGDVLAYNATDEDIAAMEEIVAREESNPADYDLYLECDYEFHLQMYKATQCTALESFQTLLYRNFSGTPKVMGSRNFVDRFKDSNQCSHRDVLEAIKSRIPEVIQAAMRRHLQAPFEKLKKNTSRPS